MKIDPESVLRAGRATITIGLAVGLSMALAGQASAQVPAGYYDSVDTSSDANLRATLHDVIDDHVRHPYTSSATDTWDILELADQDPNNSSNILEVYGNQSFAKQGGGNSFYNREHSWPKSFGFPNDNSSNLPYTDCHHLFLSDDGYNSSRSNKPYDYCTSGCSEKTTVANDGTGGGSGSYPGNSNWTSGSGSSTGKWETWGDRRGDVARALFYMDIRYEGDTHGSTGVSEPDLILTNNRNLIVSNSSSNASVAYMGLLSVLIEWHHQDPVDAKEMRRNDEIAFYQGNRNPFIDNPEWVECLFNNVCNGEPPPPPPPPPDPVSGSVFFNEFHYDDKGSDQNEFVEVAGPSGTDLSGWTVVAYNGSTGDMYKTVNLVGTILDQQGCMGTESVSFSGLQNGSPDGLALVDPAGDVVEFISYEGTLTASNGPAAGMTSTDIGVSENGSGSKNDSLQRAGTGSTPGDFTWASPSRANRDRINSGQTFSDTCGGGGGEPTGDPWINELHYDNSSTDIGEFVEVAGPAGLDLSGWELVGYNGNGGSSYKVVTLSGTVPDQGSGLGTVSFSFTSMQNGGPDGMALVDDTGTVVQFISYEGSFTAGDGPAAGMSSTDIGVAESSSTSVGHSLQMTGAGCSAADFTWAPPGTDTPGTANSGQIFSCP